MNSFLHVSCHRLHYHSTTFEDDVRVYEHGLRPSPVGLRQRLGALNTDIKPNEISKIRQNSECEIIQYNLAEARIQVIDHKIILKRQCVAAATAEVFLHQCLFFDSKPIPRVPLH